MGRTFVRCLLGMGNMVRMVIGLYLVLLSVNVASSQKVFALPQGKSNLNIIQYVNLTNNTHTKLSLNLIFHFVYLFNLPEVVFVYVAKSYSVVSLF